MQDKLMKHISMTSQFCSGCTACASVCSKGAISFSVDEEGFKVPIVDEHICIDCGLCVKTCPAINIKDCAIELPPQAYALQEVLRYLARSAFIDSENMAKNIFL